MTGQTNSRHAAKVPVNDGKGDSGKSEASRGTFVILEETGMQTDTVGRESIGKVIKIYRTKK